MYGIGKGKETARPAAVSLNRTRRFRRYLLEQAVFLRDGNMLKEKGGSGSSSIPGTIAWISVASRIRKVPSRLKKENV